MSSSVTDSAIAEDIEPEREIPLGSYLSIGPSLVWLVIAVALSVIAILGGGNSGHLGLGVGIAAGLLALWFYGTRQPLSTDSKAPIARLYQKGYWLLKDPGHKTQIPPATTIPRVRQLGKIELIGHEIPGQQPLGVVWDKSRKTMAATLVVPGAPLSGMSEEAQASEHARMTMALDKLTQRGLADLVSWGTMQLVGEPVNAEAMLKELQSASHTMGMQPLPGVWVLDEVMQALGKGAVTTLTTVTVSVHVPTALRRARQMGADTAKVVLMQELSQLAQTLTATPETKAAPDLPGPYAMSVPELILFNGMHLDPVAIKPWWDRWLQEPDGFEVSPAFAIPSFVEQKSASYAQSGSSHFRVFCVAGVEGLTAKQFAAIQGLPLSKHIRTILEPIPKGRARWRAERMTHAHDTIAVDQSTKGQSVTQHALTRGQQAEAAERELAQTSAQDFRAQTFVSVWGRTPEEAMLNAAIVAQTASNAGVVLVALEGQHLQGLTYTAPWNRWSGRSSRLANKLWK